MASGFLFSAFLSACKTPLGVIKTHSDNGFVNIPLTEFATGDYKLVRVANYNYDLAIQKTTNGTYQVLVLMCTHARQPLTKTGSNYYCTLHGSQFSHDGQVLKGPAERHLVELKAVNNATTLLIQLDQSL